MFKLVLRWQLSWIFDQQKHKYFRWSFIEYS